MPKLLRPVYWCTVLAVAICLGALSTPARAGTQATPMGLADFMAGVLPPPGVYWLNYLAYVNKSSLRDDQGDKLEIKTPVGKLDTDLKASVIVEAARFVWMTNFKILGATYGVQTIIPYYHVDANLKVGGNPAWGGVQNAVGDIIINPLILAWHFSPNFHMGFGLDIVAPTGQYNKDMPHTTIVNTNVWTFEPLLAVSYWVPHGIDLSAKFMYDFHTANRDVRGSRSGAVTPGQEFHFDWGASWGFGKGDALRAGLAGFCYWQTTVDKDGEIKADSDTKARQYGIGPAFKYWPNMGPFSIEAKYLYEFGTRNAAQGYSVWIDTILAF